MATKKSIKLAAVAATTFAQDKAIILNAFTTVVYFDWEPVKAALQKYQADAVAFENIKLACWEHSIMKAAAKLKVSITETVAHELARHDTRKEGARKLTDDEQAMRKAARNSWFYFTTKCEIKAQGVNAGNTNKPKVKGKRGATNNPPASTVPVVPQAFVVETAQTLTSLVAQYRSFKFALIKLQAANAKMYQGDLGNAILAAHKVVIASLNSIAAD